MSETPRTDAAFKESIQWDFQADYMRGKMKELERELAAVKAERDALLNSMREIKNACNEGSLLAIASIGTALEKKVRL